MSSNDSLTRLLLTSVSEFRVMSLSSYRVHKDLDLAFCFSVFRLIRFSGSGKGRPQSVQPSSQIQLCRFERQVVSHLKYPLKNVINPLIQATGIFC